MDDHCLFKIVHKRMLFCFLNARHILKIFCYKFQILFWIVFFVILLFYFIQNYIFLKGHYLPNRKFLLPVKTIRYD